MTTGFMLKARAVWLLGIGLVVAGLLPLVFFAGHLLLPPAVVASVLDSASPLLPLPMHDAAQWMPEEIHPGLLFAGLGLALMALGAIVTGRQRALIEAAKRRREDGQRRVRQYRESPRIEPFIGRDAIPGAGEEKAEAGEQEPGEASRRRVA